MPVRRLVSVLVLGVLGAAPALAFAPALMVVPQSVANGFDASLFAGSTPLQGLQSVNTGGFDSGDVDEDGLPDLVAFDFSVSGAMVFTNLGGGSFGAPVPHPMAGGVVQPGDPRLLDVNGDGHLDVLACFLPAAKVSVLLGDGDGGFTGMPFSGTGASYGESYDVADLDGDGQADVVVLDASPLLPTGSVKLLRGHGDGSFDAAQVLSGTRRATSVLARDLDADGHMDIVYLDSDTTTSVTVIRGLGNGAFAPGIGSAVNGDIFGPLVTADANGDGILDLYKLSRTLGQVALLTGAGDGSFTPKLVVSAATSPFSTLDVSDLDRDGVPDLIVSNATTVLAQRMGLAGGIGAPASFTVLPDVTGLLASDLDGDGLADLVGSDSTGAAVLPNAMGPVIDIGYGQQGPAGTPKLTLTGSPAAGSPVILGITGVTPGIPALLVVGYDTAWVTIITAPGKTALIVPAPDLVITVPAVVLPAVAWPAGIPAGAALYLQALVLPPAGKKVGSNALVVVAE
jgi:hypothetical protein